MNVLRKLMAVFAIMMTALDVGADPGAATTVSGLHLAGEVKDGMLGGRLAFRLDNVRPGGSVPVLGGSAAIVSQTLPAGMTLLRCSLCAEHSGGQVDEILARFERAGRRTGIIG